MFDEDDDADNDDGDDGYDGGGGKDDGDDQLSKTKVSLLGNRKTGSSLTIMNTKGPGNCLDRSGGQNSYCALLKSIELKKKKMNF